jgi:hypothetical protein
LTICADRVDGDKSELICNKPGELINILQANAGFVSLGLSQPPVCEDKPATNLNIISTFTENCNLRASCDITNKFLSDNQLFDFTKYASKLNTAIYFPTPLKLLINYNCISK